MTLTRSSDFGFVTGLYNPEDLERVPGTDWLITSGMSGPEHPQGHLYLVHAVTKSCEELFPSQVAFEPRGGIYGDVEPPDIATLNAHGLAIRPGDGGIHTLYLVNHGQRESIEVFEVDATGERPKVTWIGAILQAPRVWGNAVAPLPDGGIVATNYLDLEDASAFDRVYAGLVTGSLMEWHADRGWEEVPHSAFSTPNGVNVSADGRWYYVGSWATKSLVRLSRGAEPVRRDTIQLDFLVDNIKWSEDGQVLAAGQVSEPRTVFGAVTTRATCSFPVVAVKVHPETLEVQELARFEDEVFGTASTAFEVDGVLWIANAAGDRVAYSR